MYRRGSLQDCEGVYRLICEMEEEALPYGIFKEIYEENIRSGDHIFLIWEEENVPAGVIHLRFERQLHHCEKIGEIMELAVSSRWRSGGIGAKLMRAAEETASEEGSPQIEVACNERRTGAHRFYMREGFEKSHGKFSKRLNLPD